MYSGTLNKHNRAMAEVRRVITDEEAQFFLDNGFLIIRGLLAGKELGRLQADTGELVELGSREGQQGPDCRYGTGHQSGKTVLCRIDYVIDKREACKVLLGHPFILRSVERLMGPDFIPTWDAMVLKMPGEGIIVPWHRDAAVGHVGDEPIFNVDFYLDEATLGNCLWIYPGSQRWNSEQVERITRQSGFSTAGAVPVPMQPGDVLFHDIRLVHGSPSTSAATLRRVVYYEFRPAHVESSQGPHKPEYIPLKQRVLLDCIERRAKADYVGTEEPYQYNSPPPFAVAWTPGTGVPTHRYPHEQYWRAGKP